MLSYTAPAVTPAEAQAYIDGRGLIGWPLVLNEQTAALRRGQDYIAREYNHRWLVSFDDTNAPDVVKFAIVEAALAEAKSPGVLSPQVTAASAKVLTKVGEIQWTPISGGSGLTGIKAMKPTLVNVDAMLASVAIPTLVPAMLVV